MAGGKIDILIDPDTRGFDSRLAAGLRGATGVAAKVGKGIALALAAGTAVAGFGLQSVIKTGQEYEAQLNTLQAVTSATGVEMRQVAATARALGADMSLPATSAADAAAAMTELAKGGFTVQQSMDAAKGTLQLAAAAQIEAAAAAEIQANALNTFGLKADQAGRVADVLANTANAASGEITDMAQALQQAGSVANQMGVSIEDTATALGLLANNGIKGSDAGTLLKTALTQLSSPSKPAAAAIRELGLTVFDAQGRFVGLRSIMDQLNQASRRMTQEQFAAATSTVFGTDAVRLAGVAAQTTAAEWDQMAQAVSRAGGAQELAAAKTKGVGGAIEGLKSQLESASIGIFEAISGPVEAGVRKAADVVADLTPVVVDGVETAVAAGQVFGPRLADALRDRGAVVVDAVRDVLGPVAETVPDILNAAINAAIGLWEDFTDVLKRAVDAAKPVAKGFADVAKAAVEADGPLSAVGAAIDLAGDATKFAAGLLIPLGKIVGGIASAFADLPGPIQSAIIAMGLAVALRGPLGSVGDTVRDRVTAPFKALGEEVRLQQALLTGSTNVMSAQVGKVGLAMAALESRVPVIGKIADAYRTGSTAAEGFVRSHTGLAAASLAIQGASEGTVRAVQGAGSALGTFSGVVAGTARAVGTGLRSALSGLVGVLGGPWGVALAAAGVGLSLLAGNQQRAAQKAAEHAGWVESLTQALRDSNGAIDENVRRNVLKKAQDDGVLDTAKRMGIAQEELTRAIFEGGPALDFLRERLQRVVAANTEVDTSTGTTIETLNDTGKAAQGLIGQIDSLAGGFQSASEKNRQLEDAIRKGNVSMLDATGAGKDLSGAMAVLRDNTASADDRARALKDALDALSGGQISLEAAQARLNETMRRLSDLFGENVDKAKGWGAALLNADGSINTVLPNGKALFDIVRDLGEELPVVAQRTFDTAREMGVPLPAALEKARAATQATRDEFIKQAIQAGLTADQATNLADRYKLIPDLVSTLIETPGMTQTQLELILVRELINKIPPGKDIPIRSLSDDAKKKLQELGFIVTTLPNGEVLVRAHTAGAQDSLNDFINRNQNKVIGVRVETRYVAGAGGRHFEFAGGGIVKAYAAGGVEHKLTPMRVGVAQIVPPNTWRVVGDRLVDDEAYIPINRSSRSVALLQETAARMGYDLIRKFALGGIANAQSSRNILADRERAAVVIQNLELRALSDRFSLAQVQDELYFNGVR